MRFPLTATMILAALPSIALAQSVNPSGMTLPNFQASALLTTDTSPLVPVRTAENTPSLRQAAPNMPDAKVQTVADTAPANQQKP